MNLKMCVYIYIYIDMYTYACIFAFLARDSCTYNNTDANASINPIEVSLFSLSLSLGLCMFTHIRIYTHIPTCLVYPACVVSSSVRLIPPKTSRFLKLPRSTDLMNMLHDYTRLGPHPLIAYSIVATRP